MNIAQIKAWIFNWEKHSSDTIDVKRCYIDLADDLAAGVMLSQIIFWHLPNKENGSEKLRVSKEGEMWIAKKREGWWDECRLHARQVDRAVDILLKKNLIFKANYKFAGSPCLHVRLNFPVLFDALQRLFTDPESVKSISPNGEVHLTDSGSPFNESVKSISPNGEVLRTESIVQRSPTENTTETCTANAVHNDEFSDENSFVRDEKKTSSQDVSSPAQSEEISKTTSTSDAKKKRVDEIINAYPAKVAMRETNKEVVAAITRLQKGIDIPNDPNFDPKKASTWLKERVLLYAQMRDGGDKKFTPNPAKWFKQGRYLDDPQGWQEQTEREKKEMSNTARNGYRPGATADDGLAGLPPRAARREQRARDFLAKNGVVIARHAGTPS